MKTVILTPVYNATIIENITPDDLQNKFAVSSENKIFVVSATQDELNKLPENLKIGSIKIIK